ncbi:hypothetical protein AAY473_010215 [Plecturocebus cupreus]
MAHCNLHFLGSDRASLCHPGWSLVARSWLTATSASQVQGQGFSIVAQAGLELPTSSDPPTSASQGAEITVPPSGKLRTSGSMWVFLGSATRELGGDAGALRASEQSSRSMKRTERVQAWGRSLSDARAGVQWHNDGSLKPQPPRPKQSSRLSLQRNWD